jgi:hypothetical protein
MSSAISAPAAAGRITETVTRIKIALPTAYPYQAGFAMLADRIAKLPPPACPWLLAR